MTKYIFNYNMHGYESTTVEEFDSSKDESLLVVVIDKSCDSNTSAYYKLVDNALKNKNRILLIGVEDENISFKPIASLMITYRAYDIYTVLEKDNISAEYLITIEDREPDLTEVQTYIGGDVTAYTDLSTLLFGIESLVDEGNQEKLKDFLEEHLLSIENMTTTLNNMKKTCEVFSSGELIDKINSMKAKEDKYKKDLEDKDKAIADTKYEYEKCKVDKEELKRENDKLKIKNNELKSQTESGGTVISTYKEVNTSLINCKTKLVLYFKEVSYVSYVNTLVSQICGYLDMCKLKHKLIIYDTQNRLYSTYKPLNPISGRDYITMKDTLISKTPKFVVTEPNKAVIEDILTSEQCFDVVIIYDRMKEPGDIVTGNNVTKFFIINSSKDYNEVKDTLKIKDNSFIITNAHSTIDSGTTRQFLDIPYIEGYSKQTDAAKSSKYLKLKTSFADLQLIPTIIKKSRINTLINN